MSARSDSPGETLIPNVRRIHRSRPPRMFLAALRAAGLHESRLADIASWVVKRHH